MKSAPDIFRDLKDKFKDMFVKKEERYLGHDKKGNETITDPDEFFAKQYKLPPKPKHPDKDVEDEGARVKSDKKWIL